VDAGQWLTHDPLGEVDSVNLYAFNRFDSVNFVDPFGLKTNSAAAGETVVICREPDGYTCGPKGKAAREKAAHEKAALDQEQNALKRDLPRPASPSAEKKEEPSSAPKKVAKATYELWKGYGEFLGDTHWSYWVWPNVYAVGTANAKVDRRFSMFLVQSGLTPTDVSSIGLILASLDALPKRRERSRSRWLLFAAAHSKLPSPWTRFQERRHMGIRSPQTNFSIDTKSRIEPSKILIHSRTT
jgi:hypothetical protein